MQDAKLTSALYWVSTAILFTAAAPSCGGGSADKARTTPGTSGSLPSPDEKATAGAGQEKTADLPEDPIELIKFLTFNSSRTDDVIDWEFYDLFQEASNAVYGDQGMLAAQNDRSESLNSLLNSIPGDCSPQYELNEGYTAVAIPPPMEENSDEDAELIDKVIDGLGEGVEVAVFCKRIAELDNCQADEEYDPGPDCVPDTEEYDEYIFSVNLFQSSTGAWKIRAWADMQGPSPCY